MIRKIFLSALAGAGLTISIAQAQIVEPLVPYASSEVMQSIALYNEGLLHSARVELRRTLLNFPETYPDRAIILQSDVEISSGNYARAETLLGEFLQTRRNSPLYAHAWFERGLLALERKNYVKAQEFFTESFKAAEKDITARNESYKPLAQSGLYWTAISLSQQGKYEDAAPYFERAFKNYPDEKYADDAVFALGQIAELSNEPQRAVYYFKNVRTNYARRNTVVASLIREAQNNLILRDAGAALVSLSEASNVLKTLSSEDSLKTYEAQSFTENAAEEVLYLQGEAYNLAGQFDRSLAVFKELLQQYPESRFKNQANLSAGWAELNKGDNNAALGHFDAILQSGDNDKTRVRPLAQLYRIVALKGKGEREQAQKELSALSVQPAYPYLGQILLELGQMQYEDKQYVNATRTLERADREASDAVTSVRTKLLLGAVYTESENEEKAVRSYTAALQLAEKSADYMMPLKERYLAEARLKRGIALAQSKQYRDAISSLRSFVAEHPRDIRQDEAAFWLGESYYRSDLLTNAEESFKNLLKNYPKSERREESMYALGWTAFRKREFSKANQLFGELLKAFPKSEFAPEVLVRKGDGHYVLKEYSSAASAYREAVSRAPKSDEGQYAAYQLGQALYRAGSYSEAISAFKSFVRTNPNSELADDAMYSIGWTLFQNRQYAQAIDEFNNFLGAYSGSQLVPRALYTIADAQYNLGNFDAALVDYKKVRDKYPTSPYGADAVRGMQYALIALGRDAEAPKVGDDFVAQYPQTKVAEEVKYRQGELFYNGRNFASAVTEYEDFLAKYPDSEKNSEAMFWLGKSYISMQDSTRAEKVFSDLEKKYPKSNYVPEGLLELALMHIELNRPQKADSIFGLLTMYYPENQIAQRAGFERGILMFSQGDTVRSMDVFKATADKYPGTDYGDQARYQIAMYHRLREKYDESRYEFLKLADRKDNLGAEAQYRIGELWMREKNYAEAREAFKDVRENFAGFEDWYSLSLLNLGESYEKLEDIESAREVYQALAALRPDDDFGATANARLKRLTKS
ncbi:MAG: tetratricopeptide repeat protein [Bacteroidota bacterium]